MNDQVRKIQSIYGVKETQFVDVTLPFVGMGYVDWLISFFSNERKQPGFGPFDVGVRKEMAAIVQADADGSLFGAHKAELEAIAGALNGTRL